jgi:hypothetical protein
MNQEHVISDELFEQALLAFSKYEYWIAYNTVPYFLEKTEMFFFKEKKEADRKIIEAEGIKNFQNIVSDGISDNLLQWKGIEATQALTQSQNAKIIIVGGANGLPLILNSS